MVYFYIFAAMKSKKELTTAFILEKVAPVFIKNGFAGTNFDKLNKATGMSKGAIYGNFKNKQDLALKTFNYIVRKALWPVADFMNVQPTAELKLKAMTEFYRVKYPRYMEKMGGCPLLSVGIDAKNLNEALFVRVKEVVEKLKNNLAVVIQAGIDKGEFKDIDADVYAGRIYATIQGSIFLTTTLGEMSYLIDMMNSLDKMIDTELRK